jgi:hypothetical protein
VLLAACAVAVACEGAGGSGDGGRVAVTVESAPGCQALGPSAFPPGLELLPDDPGLGVGLNFAPPGVVPLDLTGEAPRLRAGVPILGIPDDSDGDGVPEGTGGIPDSPKLDGVHVGDPELAAAGLGLLTASGYEEVIVFEPARGALARLEIEVDGGFAPEDFRRLPAPGTSAERTAISSDACIKPAAPIASNGDDYAAGVDPAFFCDPAVAGSFYAKFTSGAAVAAGRLFVSVSNLGDGGGTPFARYLPGAVLVFDVDLLAATPWASPNPSTPFIETFAYNPTHLTRLEAGGRELVLVTASGALGIVEDDPGTPAIEAGTISLSPAAIEVIDPETLEIVAGTPLTPDAALAFDRIALHPSGRVAAIGSAGRRSVYLLDLAGAEDLPTTEAQFEELPPLLELGVPPLPSGPPPATCSGFTGGVAFNDAGDLLYVTERCDGTLTRFAVDLPADPNAALDVADFPLLSSQPLVASLSPDTFGEVRDPGVVRVRPGRPGVDFRGPDLFFLASQPDGQSCAKRQESL